MKIYRSISTPIRKGKSWHDLWEGPDGGVVACWERGREKAREDAELAAEAKSGRLVVLPWKGGVEKPIKAAKVGTLHYLAMWQGLRGDDLDIDTDAEVTMTCPVTNVTVLYTGVREKYCNA